jgi:hypothetical protein
MRVTYRTTYRTDPRTGERRAAFTAARAPSGRETHFASDFDKRVGVRPGGAMPWRGRGAFWIVADAAGVRVVRMRLRCRRDADDAASALRQAAQHYESYTYGCDPFCPPGREQAEARRAKDALSQAVCEALADLCETPPEPQTGRGDEDPRGKWRRCEGF